jgi:hypothetical protein
MAFESRLAINVPLFTKALALRRRIASLLGYKTWADFVTEEKMVGSAEGVFKVGVICLILIKIDLNDMVLTSNPLIISAVTVPRRHPGKAKARGHQRPPSAPRAQEGRTPRKRARVRQ